MTPPDRSALPLQMRWLLWLAATVGLGIGFHQAWMGSAPSAGVSLGAGILMLLLSEANRFEVLRGFGFEAKLKTLDAKLDHAEQLAEQLRAFTLTWGRNVVGIVTSQTGYSERFSRLEQNDMVKDVENGLRALAVSQAEIDEVLSPYYRLVEDRIVHKLAALMGALRKNIPGAVAATGSNQGRRNLDMLLDTQHPVRRDPEAWRRAISYVATAGIPSTFRLPEWVNDVNAWVDDLEHWQRTRALRRPVDYFGEDAKSL